MVRQSLGLSSLPRTFATVVVAIIAGCAAPTKAPPPAVAIARTAPDLPPPAPREFRAAWVATVANIDWPSRKDLSVAQQKAEIIQIVERAKSLNLNALIFQVRTSADALYDSKIEPWSEYLTGAQGRAPEPFYDPLKMWVEESHKRGIELHAWFNPYRARHNQAKSPPAPSHIANTIPAAVKSYGGYLWMDPGEPAASKQTLDVILDVVRRYDIDGVHIDDYFYPYPVPVPGSEVPPPSPDDTPVARNELDFPDEPAWRKYLATGGRLTRADWRRQNVNTLVENIYNGIKREKRWVKFGVSPFGLGKPDRRPPGISGFSQYDKLYADAELWLNRGWLDYFTPQLYWPIDQRAQAFDVLLDYWVRENTQRRHLWPGIYTSRINDTAQSWQPQEIANQIGVMRSRADANEMRRGHVHFSMVALKQNRKGVNDALKDAYYRDAALIPATPWLSRTAPGSPTVAFAGNKVQLQSNARDAVTQYAVWTRVNNIWKFSSVPATTNGITFAEFTLDQNGGADRITAAVVSAVDRLGNESERIHMTVNGAQVNLTR